MHIIRFSCQEDSCHFVIFQEEKDNQVSITSRNGEEETIIYLDRTRISQLAAWLVDAISLGESAPGAR